MKNRKGQEGFALFVFLIVAVAAVLIGSTMDWTEHEEPEWYDKHADVEVNVSDKVIRNSISAEDGSWMYDFYDKKKEFSKDVFQQVEYKYSGEEWISHQFYNPETGITTVELFKYEGTLSHSQYGDITLQGCPVNKYCEVTE